MRYICAAVLSSFAFTAFAATPEQDRARAAATTKQLQMFEDAIGGYLTDFDAPPPDFASLTKGLQGTYLREVPSVDAWGTPFRYVVNGKTFVVVSAGSDLKFDESTWSKSAVTDDTSADALVSNGGVRRLWKFAGDPGTVDTMKAIEKESAKMDTLPQKEQMPYFWRKTNADFLDSIASALDKYSTGHARYPAGGIEELKAAIYPDYIDEMRVTDYWGTSLRYSSSKDGKSYTLVCAGSDKTFRPDTWATAGTFENDAEDAVIKNGKHVRDWKLLK